MESFEKTQEQIPQERRLQSQIEVMRDEKGITSNVFIVEKDKKFDLYEYLPRGVVFVSTDLPKYEFRNGDPKSKDHPPLVCFPQKEANSVSGRLGILHEMGHAIVAERNNYRSSLYESLQRYIPLVVKSIRQSAEYEKLEDQKSRESYIAREFQRAIKNSPMPESDENILVAIKDQARVERSAWANALQLYRKIKKEKGINFLGETNSKEILEMVNSNLASYQSAYGILVPKQQVKLFLTKKYLPDPHA